MWLNRRVRDREGLDAALIAQELLESTFRTVVVSVVGASWIWLLISGVLQSDYANMRVALVCLAIVINAVVTFRVLKWRLVPAQIVWQVGMLLITGLAVWALEDPHAVLALAFWPSLASAMLGWPAGVVAEMVLLALVLWLFPVMPGLDGLTESYLPTAVLVGGRWPVFWGRPPRTDC